MAGSAATSIGGREADPPRAQPAGGDIAGRVSTVEARVPARGPNFTDGASAAGQVVTLM